MSEEGDERDQGQFRPLPEVVAEAERLAESSWLIETTARLEAILWVIREVDDDRLTGAVDKDRLRSLTGSQYVHDEADLSRLLQTECDS